MARVISIQEAQAILNYLGDIWKVSSPPLYVTERIPRKYAGVYYHNSTEEIKIRPQFLTERTLVHEFGHAVFHARNPSVCKGDNPSCEENAVDFEKWWARGQKSTSGLPSFREWIRTKHGHVQLAEPRRMVTFTLTRPVTLEEAKEVTRRIADSEMGDSVDRVGFKGRKFYVVLKQDTNVDGIVITAALAALITGILGLLGIGVVGWAVGLWAPGPLGLPNIFWIFLAGTALLISLGWVVGRLMK